RVLWRKDDLHDADDIALDVLPRPPYALLRLKRGIREDVVRILIDVKTGDELWNSSTLGLADAYQQLYAPSLDALMISGRTRESDVMVIADVASGRMLRSFTAHDDEIRSILGQPLLFDTDSTLVIDSLERLKRYDLWSGDITWSSSPLEVGRREP